MKFIALFLLNNVRIARCELLNNAEKFTCSIYNLHTDSEIQVNFPLFASVRGGLTVKWPWSYDKDVSENVQLVLSTHPTTGRTSSDAVSDVSVT